MGRHAGIYPGHASLYILILWILLRMVHGFTPGWIPNISTVLLPVPPSCNKQRGSPFQSLRYVFSTQTVNARCITRAERETTLSRNWRGSPTSKAADYRPPVPSYRPHTVNGDQLSAVVCKKNKLDELAKNEWLHASCARRQPKCSQMIHA